MATLCVDEGTLGSQPSRDSAMDQKARTEKILAEENFQMTHADNKTEEHEEENEAAAEKQSLPISADDFYRNGIALFTGSKTIAKDQEGAVKLWERAVKEHDHMESRVLLGMAHWNGEGAEQNISKAVDLLRTAGRSGERGAQGAYFLAMAYMEGNKVEQDTPRAHRWLRQAAKFKHKDAMYELGASMISSKDPDQLSRGCDWIAAAAEKGHVRAKEFMNSASKVTKEVDDKGGVSKGITAGGGTASASSESHVPKAQEKPAVAKASPPAPPADDDDWLTGVEIPKGPVSKAATKTRRKNKGR